MPIDPVTGWTIVKNIADATKKLYDVARGLKDYETKQKLDEVLDELRDLKQQASDLEDENRELRESLRFKTTISSSRIHSISRRNTPTGHCARRVSRSKSSLPSQHLTTMDTGYGVNACHVTKQLKRNEVGDMTPQPTA